jgi:hypothetical protein
MNREININDLIQPKQEIVIEIPDNSIKCDYVYGSGKEKVELDINLINEGGPGDICTGQVEVPE